MNLKTFLHTLADSSNEIDHLILPLLHQDIRLRGPALRQLLRLHTPVVEERLFALLRADDTHEYAPLVREDDSVFVDVSFIQNVLRWRGRIALPFLLDVLYDPVFLVRKVVVYVLGKLSDPEIFPAIFQMLINDPMLEQYDTSGIFFLTESVALQHLDLLISALRLGDAEQRRFVVGFLRFIGPSVFSSVLPLLAEQDANLRRIAAELLGTSGSLEAVDELIAALRDSDAEVRNQAVGALHLLNAQQALPALMEIVNDADSVVRYTAMDAVKSMGGPDLLEMRIAALDDPDVTIRANAALSLSSYLRSSESLVAALHDPMTEVRFNAIVALYHRGDQSAVEPLIAALADADPSVCAAAATFLGEFGGLRAVEPLIAAFVKFAGGDPEGVLAPGFYDSNGATRDQIIRALGKIGDLRAVETLIAALNDPGAYIRTSAIRGLEKFGDQRAVAPLLKCLLEEYNTSVIEALVSLGGYQAIEGLYSVLLESQKYPEYLCHSVAQALRTLQQPAPRILFSRLYDAETLAERNKVVEILGALGDLQAFTPLLTVLNNVQEDLSVRSAAVYALHELAGEQSVELLIAILSRDSSRIVRAQAASVLKGSQQPGVLVALLKALSDEATIVRVVAAHSLESFGDPQVLPALQAMMAREITREDDFEDYLADMKYFSRDILLFLSERLPEEYVMNSINFLQT